MFAGSGTPAADYALAPAAAAPAAAPPAAAGKVWRSMSLAEIRDTEEFAEIALAAMMDGVNADKLVEGAEVAVDVKELLASNVPKMLIAHLSFLRVIKNKK